MQVTIHNFFSKTFGLFKGCKRPKRNPDYISYSKKYPDLISSEYWYGVDKNGKYVIRFSDHWVRYKNIKNDLWEYGCKMIASCNWQLKANFNKLSNKNNCGKIYLNKMKFQRFL